MATYATVQDFEDYTTGQVPADPVVIEQLLERAEKDLDRAIIPVWNKTNSVQGIAVTGANGGFFGFNLDWRGVTYVSHSLSWDATGVDVLAALQSLADAYGNPLAPGVWQRPEVSYYSQPWAFGPLDSAPVVVEAINSLGEQKLPALTTNTGGLTGPNPAVKITEIVRGGLKVNPYLLSQWDNDRLRDATCAQAEYRQEMGEAFFRRAQYKSVDGPEFKTTGRLPLLGPKVKQELTGSDLLQRGARARPGTVKGQAATYMPVGGTPIPDDWRAI